MAVNTIYCVMIVMLSDLGNERIYKVSYLSDTSWREGMRDNGSPTRSYTGLTRVDPGGARQSRPVGTPCIRPLSYSSDTIMISAEDADLWSIIEGAKAMVQGLHLHREDENAWCGGVVSLLMLHGAAARIQKSFSHKRIGYHALSFK